ncbi:Xaa-Pro peptidase family protein [Ihubacter massiliensis]|uniref:Xaa-Pro peptidase family protein n=1 Tax=Hominibacterium faecale TaxID=2839743 RepID=A0A9J6QNM0_9FIRM|nr:MULTISPECIES: Xaa-Pro peptidase family protein [Eubacteriales Family XIII. Incertae Sedis]MCI7301363.1 Xaa-Pro peptidase family protein [Clostridia bacterium]MDE8733606.1 Xaa-Pro peptidase family protein [Eubacteriales bacterium DFI.9.88]MDY3011289.1 Xaa-Pro peptidase family protein [Clostridiales Family XIII bacterium]MCO7123992.1 Xaa-Pro peptidase family protein [Ihubacter massiliensis]MCU7378984.1 Xaa-Pro peptidase family protein [Hominibacterium faecale]
MSNQKVKVLPEMDVVYENARLPFPLAEYQVRLRKIRREMAAREIDLLYLTSPESMYYISGLNLAWYRNGSPSARDEEKAAGIAVHVDHDYFILFETKDEYGLVSGSTCASDIRIMDETQSQSAENGSDLYDFVADNLKAEGWITGSAALEMRCPRTPRTVGDRMKAKLEEHGCRVVDGTDLLVKIRRKKSPMELNYIRKASAIADIGHEAAAAQLCAGMTELELAGIYTCAMMKAGGESGAVADLVQSGRGKLWCGHAPAGRKLIMPGEPVRIDLAGVYNRYHAPMGRCCYIGKPDPDFADLYHRANGLVMEEVIRILKPNMPVREFYEKLMKTCKELGLEESQKRMGGYEIGIGFAPDWCGQFVHGPNREHQDECFEPGMAVTFKTGMGGMDTILFTEDEVEILGNTTRELMITD